MRPPTIEQQTTNPRRHNTQISHGAEWTYSPLTGQYLRRDEGLIPHPLNIPRTVTFEEKGLRRQPAVNDLQREASGTSTVPSRPTTSKENEAIRPNLGVRRCTSHAAQDELHADQHETLQGRYAKDTVLTPARRAGYVRKDSLWYKEEPGSPEHPDSQKYLSAIEEYAIPGRQESSVFEPSYGTRGKRYPSTLHSTTSSDSSLPDIDYGNLDTRSVTPFSNSPDAVPTERSSSSTPTGHETEATETSVRSRSRRIPSIPHSTISTTSAELDKDYGKLNAILHTVQAQPKPPPRPKVVPRWIRRILTRIFGYA